MVHVILPYNVCGTTHSLYVHGKAPVGPGLLLSGRKFKSYYIVTFAKTGNTVRLLTEVFITLAALLAGYLGRNRGPGGVH